MKRVLPILPALTLAATGFLSSCDSNTTTNSGGEAGSVSAPIPWNTSIHYGTFTDPRDGKSYKTVKIGTQTWFAENLNYAGTAAAVGTCFNNSSDSCAKYGRLYSWSEAMAGRASSTASPSGVQGACPNGWHVPSDAEWSTLDAFVGDASTAGTRLKSTSGWPSKEIAGTDDYGFRTLPAGCHCNGGTIFGGLGATAFWSASEEDASNARSWSIDGASVYFPDVRGKSWGFSLRCIDDI